MQQLPLEDTEVRVAVGNPVGLTSNSWRFWVVKGSDIYIACRDNFEDQKISLHSKRDWNGESGPWRIAFTKESIEKGRIKIDSDEKREWEEWEEPKETLPGVVRAFEFRFPQETLALTPEDRKNRKWKKEVLFIEAGGDQKHTFLTLCINKSRRFPTWQDEKSIPICIWEMWDGRFCQLIARTAQWPNLKEFLDYHSKLIKKQAESDGVIFKGREYAYLHGHDEDGCRFFVGLKLSLAQSSF